jgi:hypothetical protein
LMLLMLGSAEQASASEWGRMPSSIRYGQLKLDFRAGVASDGVREAKLTDCSNAEYYCAASDIAAFALPRQCKLDMKVGDQWAVGPVRTRVIGSVAEPVGHLGVPGGTLFVLQSNENTKSAVLYKPSQGPLAIFHDGKQALDLSWVKPNGNGDFHQIDADPRRARSYGLSDPPGGMAICSN